MGSAGEPKLSPTVHRSWQRSLAAGVDRAAPTQVAMNEATLAAHRAEHQLAPAFPMIRELLEHTARDCDAVLAVFDAGGHLLWSTGARTALRRAEKIGFVEGSRWDETLAGTNAPGLALRLGKGVQVRGEEHFREAVQAFSCVAAPVIDPRSGKVAGVIDLTGGASIAVPPSLAALQATARLAAGLLLPEQPATSTLAIRALGRDRALVRVAGHEVELSRRHSEILALLVEHPNGMTGDELAVALYTDEVGTSTLRAELNRLKVILGEGVLGSRPYRLLVEVDADWQRSNVPDDYPGPLLPRSEAPAVVELRDRLHFTRRQHVLDSGDLAALQAWASSSDGRDDYEVWERLAAIVEPGSANWTRARGHLSRLDAEFG